MEVQRYDEQKNGELTPSILRKMKEMEALCDQMKRVIKNVSTISFLLLSIEVPDRVWLDYFDETIGELMVSGNKGRGSREEAVRGQYEMFLFRAYPGTTKQDLLRPFERMGWHKIRRQAKVRHLMAIATALCSPSETQLWYSQGSPLARKEKLAVVGLGSCVMTSRGLAVPVFDQGVTMGNLIGMQMVYLDYNVPSEDDKQWQGLVSDCHFMVVTDELHEYSSRNLLGK